MKHPYLNTKANLFQLVLNERPIYRNACIERIETKPECILHIVTALPHGQWLLELQNGTTFEFVYTECGDGQVYQNGLVLLRFTNCSILKVWIDDAITYTETMLQVRAQIKADVEIVGKSDD